MAALIDLDLDPDDRTLRQFGWIALGGFGFVAALAWFELLIFSFGLGAAKPWVAGGALALAVLATLFSLVYPRGNRWLYLGLAVVTFPIGFVLSYLIMGLLFFGLIAPLALFFRMVGRDPMQRRLDSDTQTYWIENKPPVNPARYFQQF